MGRRRGPAAGAAVALGCDIQPVSRFARKHYFYPDLPKGYQISQYDEPYALHGAVPVQLDAEVVPFRLTRIHMEEDAAKSVHDADSGGDATHVNLNRAGVPLIEIVSEPDLRTPEEAGAYLRSLRSLLRYLEVSDADMEKGNFRCDANVSVRPRGASELGVKVELKNMNSFKNVEKAIAYEIRRQIEVLEDGGKIAQETRHWDDRSSESKPSRGKEDADDYRYFPDPDLAPLVIDPARVEAIRATLPELPHEKRQHYQHELKLSAADAQLLAEDRAVAQFFEAVLEQHDDAKAVANWVRKNVLQLVRESGTRFVKVRICASS